MNPILKNYLRTAIERAQIRSMRAAFREQNALDLMERLSGIKSDLRDQYSLFKVDTEFLRLKIRGQHAFQIRLALQAVDLLRGRDSLFIVDIGDSSGVHTMYLKSIIAGDIHFRQEARFLSVNLDPAAVDRIRNNGLDALLCDAQDLVERHRINPDLYLCYETLEHLNDPISFLDGISQNPGDGLFVLTVPYLRRSRIGLHQLRNKRGGPFHPENVHIYELSPQDWKLLFYHAGWETVAEKIYRQYPLGTFWRIMKPVWKRFDFEGFYGAILRRNRSWADQRIPSR